jgi:hypothetical protein
MRPVYTLFGLVLAACGGRTQATGTGNEGGSTAERVNEGGSVPEASDGPGSGRMTNDSGLIADAASAAEADSAASCHIATPDPPQYECNTIDLSWYDRSCLADSDCVAVEVGGGICSGQCFCYNAAINVRDRACYERSVPPPVVEDAPSCRNCFFAADPSCDRVYDPPARCINGMCTYCGH